MNDVKDKLEYLFGQSRMNFGDEIDYKNIEDNVKDITVTSNDNTFSNIRGLKHFRIRDIHTSVAVYEPNTVTNYPQYKTQNFDEYVENRLRVILLGPGQFPMFDSSVCSFSNEG
jgi:hypothetical protein